jgi:hypothetical protein
MPTVLRIKGWRVGFFSADADEPPHVHVSRDANAAKFWLDPVELEENVGYQRHELNEIARVLVDHQRQLLDAWHEYCR